MRKRQPPKNPLDHEPEAVKYARRNAGLTQADVAELCEVSLSLISEIEKGTRNATPEMLNKLATALNCPRVVLERKREPETAQTRAVDLLVRHGERADTSEVPDLPEDAPLTEAS